MSNLIQVITMELLTDDQGDDRQALRIEKSYNEASEKEKQVIDDIFISLCGYSMASLIEKKTLN